ncbi:MAG: hypothetical protein ABR557_02690 [Pyrinomonadaceae bacterium]
MSEFARISAVVLFVLFGAVSRVPGQDSSLPTPSPAKTVEEKAPVIYEHPEQEPIRTLTEEIQLTLSALDSLGHLDPALELEDILLLEDGVVQEIRSARRVPAHVLLLQLRQTRAAYP